MFKSVKNKVDLPKLEEEILDFWDDAEIFSKSTKQKPENNTYFFQF